MHDLKNIRTEPESFRLAMQRRGVQLDLDSLLKLDEEKRTLTAELDELRMKRNAVSKEIGKFRKNGQDSSVLELEMKQLGQDLKLDEEREKELSRLIKDDLLRYPNLPAADTPDGLTSAENVELRQWGTKPVFDFPVRDHLELAERLDILDFKRASKITGSGFPLWKGLGAQLERALLNFMLDVQTTEHGYTEVLTPFLANRDSMIGSGQIPKLEDDMYFCEREELYLIPTSEVTLINMHRGEILDESQLPVAYTAYSPCFRREAGTYGAQTRGFLRTHQFNKVEMVRIVRPEDSQAAWEEMTAHAEEILKRLELPYRVLRLCAGDMSFNAVACYDLEAWSPADGGSWLEVSSISNCEAFQARRSDLRYRPTSGGKAQNPHLLNGSGLATSRLLVALLECYQTEEGSIAIPSVLRPYMGGKSAITRQS